MLNCMGLATVQRGHMGPVCLLGSVVSSVRLWTSKCRLAPVKKIANSAVRVNGLFVVE